MADVHPFRGVRYNPDLVPDLSLVISPPYDVISPEFQQELYQRSPYNIVRIEYGREEPESNRYTAADRFLREWRRQEVLVGDREPAFYLLQEQYTDSQGKSRVRDALFGCVRLEEFSKEVIFPHEETTVEAKQDRLDLIRACRANLSPIMGLYRDPSGRIAQVLQEAKRHAPLADANRLDGQAFKIWPILQGERSAIIRDAFSHLPIFLADGHHRYETALRYRDLQRLQRRQEGGHDFVMMALIDLADPGLQLHGYHRLISDMDTRWGNPLDSYLERIFQVVATEQLSTEISEASQRVEAILKGSPYPGRAIGLVDNRGLRFRLLILREDAQVRLAEQNTSIPELAECDVWTLQEGVLSPLLTSQDQQSVPRLQYAHDAAGAILQLQGDLAQVAVLLRPLPLELFEAVVSRGVRLPPKSTYFSPKLPTGFVIHDLVT